MASTLVIKVKYEETLRRFNVAVSEGDQRLDLSMEGLRLKISSLFNLPLDSNFRLTYKDEDGDLVTLVDDDDLHDVVRQGLNPVRITVHLSSDQSAQSSFTPAERVAPSTPSSQNVQPNVVEALSHVLMNLSSSIPNMKQSSNPNVAEIVKSVQEPLAQALSKLSIDMSSKAKSTSPILGDLFDGLSKMGESCLNAAISKSSAANGSSHNNVGDDSKPNPGGRNPEGSADPMQPVPRSTQVAYEDTTVKHPSCPVSFDKGKHAGYGSPSSKKSTSCVSKKNMDMSAQNAFAGWNASLSKGLPLDAPEKESMRDASERFRRFQSHFDPIPSSECPFGGIPLMYDRLWKPLNEVTRSHIKADSQGSIFHKGVRCDGCGVLPITGPRFKSKVKYDYDLCNICFSRTGNDTDYTRMDFPLPQVHTLLSKARDARSFRQCPARPHASKHLRSRLDSRFITDVNVMDGTTMAPLTPFTKIWRMRNNGTLSWNHGFQLIWIGGDRFSPSDSIEIQVPANGIDVGAELDIAVDFIAPELPGRYISYWRMAEPSGHKFGQRVWVQIEVDPSVDLILTHEKPSMLDLNIPLDINEPAFREVHDVKTEPGFIVEVCESSAPSIPELGHNIETERLNFPTNDDLLVTGDVVYPNASSTSPSSSGPPPLVVYPSSTPLPSLVPTPVTVYHSGSFSPSSSVSPPAVSSEIPVSSSPVSFSEASAPLLSFPAIANLEQASVESKSEEKLLNELAQMGFKQIELNKEVLRMNEYDLKRSVDDLCDVSEWDPMLEELKEMGFNDKEANKKLLAKNNGSITRVVMDLIAEEEA